MLLAHHLHGDKITLVNVLGLGLTLSGMLIHGLTKPNAQRKLSRLQTTPVESLALERPSVTIKSASGSPKGAVSEDQERLLQPS